MLINAFSDIGLSQVPEQVFAQIVDEIDQHQRQQASPRETDLAVCLKI